MLKIDKQDITLTRGDTAYLQFIPVIADDDGDPVDYKLIEGDSVVFRLKTDKIIFSKECIIDTENNTSILTLTEDDTKDLDFQTYYYEVELITNLEEHFTFIANQRFTIGKELDQHGN